MAIHKLRRADIKTLPDGMHNDGNGLYLRVRGNARSWILRARIRGVLRDFGLGSIRDVSLADARARVSQRRLKEKFRQVEVVRGRRDFRTVADEALANYRRAKNVTPSRYEQIEATLSRYASGLFGRQVGSVTVDDVLSVIRPLWTTKHPTSVKVLQALRIVFRYAKMRGYIDTMHPVEKDVLMFYLPPESDVYKEKHATPIPLDMIAVYVAEMVRSGAVAKIAAVFGIATALRRSEFVSAEWSDIDFENRIYTAKRTKGMDTPFRVPLSDKMVGLLKKIPKDHRCPYVFSIDHEVVSVMRVRRVFCAYGVSPHSLRSSFSMWCAENGVDPYIREACLRHVTDDKVAAAYQQSDLLERRRVVMNQWSDFIFSLV